MELNGEVMIAAARPRVWAALNDPDTLARCIEGVESLTRVADAAGERFEGRMNAKVGPVRATFTGHVALEDVVAPVSYRLVGEGKGGVAGFAKGEAMVTLTEMPAATGAAADQAQTLLSYQVTSSVGGKLAQLGARLIEGTAKGLAESFFARLKAEIETPAGAAADAPATVHDLPGKEAAAPVAQPVLQPVLQGAPIMPPATGLPPFIWGGAIILGVLAFLLWQWSF